MNHNMDWQPIELSELDAIVDLLALGFPIKREQIAYDMKKIWEDQTGEGVIHRLKVDGELVGTATFGRLYTHGSEPKGQDWEGESIIRYLTVHPDHRRKGYAKWIIQRIIRHSYITGSPCIAVSNLSTDEVGHKIWESFGFTQYNTNNTIYGKHDCFVKYMEDMPSEVAADL